ncbi:MAG TPA: transcription antitermination factor NusB [Urbifossiella sp.]|jgi:N utilization substance protein B|nr:transcription antitermination factor NusB [Urbifossiella sp.]
MLTRRSRAREVALQLLFQKDQNPAVIPRKALERFARDRLVNEERLKGGAALTVFALALYDGTLAHQTAIDPTISSVAENWRLSRMNPVDRNVLRLASYELLHDSTRQPVEVVLDEAIELARRFGSKESPAFVNGILDRIGKMRPAAPPS